MTTDAPPWALATSPPATAAIGATLFAVAAVLPEVTQPRGVIPDFFVD